MRPTNLQFQPSRHFTSSLEKPVSTKLTIDEKNKGRDMLCPVKVSFYLNKKTAYITTNIRILFEQWDNSTSQVICHPNSQEINLLLRQILWSVDASIAKLQERGALYSKDATEIKNLVEEDLDPKRSTDYFLNVFDAFTETKEKWGTKITYIATAKKIRAFDVNAERLHFEDINPDWLRRFDKWMSLTAPSANARSIILRNIRTVFNYAIENDITTYYPFRKFKIKQEATKSRALTLEQCRAFMTIDCDDKYRKYLDMFRLSFYLGGISFCDLCALTWKDNLRAGRIEYKRLKTNQFCSIALMPEAKEIIDRYKGVEHLVDISETNSNYRFFLHNMNDALKHIGCTHYSRKTLRWEGEPICPEASQYWARYSIATFAAELGYSVDVIGAMLGHSSNTCVTSIYIRTNRKKQVDAALRRVIDYVLGKGDSHN